MDLWANIREFVINMVLYLSLRNRVKILIRVERLCKKVTGKGA